MKEELTTLMHSEFTVSPETDLSHTVACIVDQLEEGFETLDQLLDDYSVTLEQYNKYRSEWENLSK